MFFTFNVYIERVKVLALPSFPSPSLPFSPFLSLSLPLLYPTFPSSSLPLPVPSPSHSFP